MAVCWSCHLDVALPSSGANMMNRLAVPLRRRCQVPQPCSPTVARSSVCVLGRFRARQGDRLGFILAIENSRHRRRRARCLRLNAVAKPSSTSCLRARYTHGRTGIQSPDDFVVTMRCFSNRCAGPFTPRISISNCCHSSPLNRTTYCFFTEISLELGRVSCMREPLSSR
jgi:hypothetical protein